MFSKLTSRSSLLLLLCLLALNGCASLGHRPDGPVQTGKASWYGRDFHGRPTASGETYDMYKLTAAHRTLPLGTRAQVTNLDNDRKVVVKVNDRGPFVGHRIMDVSYGAAEKLGMLDSGIANVRIEVINSPESRPNNGNYCLQFGAFTERANAERLRRQLASRGYEPIIETCPAQGRTVYRVRIGSYQTFVGARSARLPFVVRGIECKVVSI